MNFYGITFSNNCSSLFEQHKRLPRKGNEEFEPAGEIVRLGICYLISFDDIADHIKLMHATGKITGKLNVKHFSTFHLSTPIAVKYIVDSKVRFKGSEISLRNWLFHKKLRQCKHQFTSQLVDRKACCNFTEIGNFLLLGLCLEKINVVFVLLVYSFNSGDDSNDNRYSLEKSAVQKLFDGVPPIFWKPFLQQDSQHYTKNTENGKGFWPVFFKKFSHGVNYLQFFTRRQGMFQ